MATVSRLIVAVAFALSVAGGVAAATHDDGATQQGAAVGGVVAPYTATEGGIAAPAGNRVDTAASAPISEQITDRIAEQVAVTGLAGAPDRGQPAPDFMAAPDVGGVLAGVEVASEPAPKPTAPRTTEPPPETTEVTEPDPTVTEPPSTEPPTTEAPSTYPPVTDPPWSEPDPTDPPWTEPPTTEAPHVTDPPETDPPTTEHEPEPTQPVEEPADEPEAVPDVPTEGE